MPIGILKTFFIFINNKSVNLSDFVKVQKTSFTDIESVPSELLMTQKTESSENYIMLQNPKYEKRLLSNEKSNYWEI